MLNNMVYEARTKLTPSVITVSPFTRLCTVQVYDMCFGYLLSSKNNFSCLSFYLFSPFVFSQELLILRLKLKLD